MQLNWGEHYFDHYAQYFGKPVGREVFRVSPRLPTIQVLEFGEIFAQCSVFATIGLSHYSQILGGVAEAYIAVDEGKGEVPKILANSLFFMVEKRIKIGRGVSISGIGNIAPRFTADFKKNAIYFTHPYEFPHGFWEVGLGKQGSVYQGVLISQEEHELFVDRGGEWLEDQFEASEVDLMQIRRSSIV